MMRPGISTLHLWSVIAEYSICYCPEQTIHRWQCPDTERIPSSLNSACCVLEYPRTPSTTSSLCTRVRSGGRNLILISVITMFSILTMDGLQILTETDGQLSRMVSCMYRLFQGTGSSVIDHRYPGTVRCYRVLPSLLTLPTSPFIVIISTGTHGRMSDFSYGLVVLCVSLIITSSVFLTNITPGISGLRKVSKYKLKKLDFFLHFFHFFRILTPLPPVSTTRIPDSKSVWTIWQFMLGHGYPHMADSMVYIQTTRVHSRQNGTHFWGGRNSLLTMEVILSFYLSKYLCHKSLSSPVNIPMGGYYEVYTSLEERSEFTYANVRKASYTGSVKQ